MAGRRRKNSGINLKLGRKTTKQIIGLFLLFAGVVSSISGIAQGAETEPVIIAIVIGVIGFFIFASTLPTFIGKMGEKKVARILKKLAKKYNGYVINDVTIPDEENGKTSQIDHILFTMYGIFVIETKNYSGRIYGNEKQLEWTQVLNYGRVKNKLYNPIKQNATHCIRLKSIINDDSVSLVSIVVFVKGNTSYIEANNVLTLRQLKRIINKNSNPILDNDSVYNAYSNVFYYKENKCKTNKEHIREISQMQKDIKNNICPRCGGKLILKISSSGKEFYGCSNYPKCDFTKKAK